MSFDPLKSRTPTNASTAMDSTSSTRRWWHLSRLWLVPAVAFVATFGVFAVRHPGSARAGLTNPATVGIGAAFLVCIAIAVWASQFRPKIRPVLPLVVTLGVLGAAFYAEVPFEQQSTQNRTLVAEQVVGPSTSTTGASTPTTSRPGTSATTAPVAVAGPAVTAVPAPTAVRHAVGALRGIDHTASGAVSVVESSAGKWVVRFENFDVQGTPQPVLYVIEGDNRTTPAGTNLGAFTATDGDLLDVALPAGVEPGAGWTVLIWCEKFDTPIANATLS